MTNIFTNERLVIYSLFDPSPSKSLHENTYTNVNKQCVVLYHYSFCQTCIVGHVICMVYVKMNRHNYFTPVSDSYHESAQLIQVACSDARSSEYYLVRSCLCYIHVVVKLNW